jgi:hypothetical protein
MKSVRRVFTQLSLAVLLVAGLVAAAAADLPQTREDGVTVIHLEPGETRTSRVTITKVGVRYRCPINVTPWYDLDVIK